MNVSPVPTLKLTIILMIFASFAQNFSTASSPASKRHVYIRAIPFHNMKLNAPVLTSLENTSRRQCGMRCLQEPRCEAFNYHVTNSTCELLSNFLCAQSHDLVTAPDFRYYDCEKEGDFQNITNARGHMHCHSEAACSPKCSCRSLGYSTVPTGYLTPDPPPNDSPVVLKDSMPDCFLACLALPLPRCRSFNTNTTNAGVVCQFLPFLASERPASRFSTGSTWSYHRRKCFT